MAQADRQVGGLPGIVKFAIVFAAGLAAVTVMFFILMISVLQGGLLTTLSNACVTGDDSGGGTYTSSDPSGEASSDIPEDFLQAYQAAGDKHGLDWAVIAAVGKQESNHGRHSAGCAQGADNWTGETAQGPMQFLPSTWASYGEDGNGDGASDPCDIEDAAMGTANYLKDLGAPGDYRGAVCQYYGRCADANANYADEVMAQAEEYRQSGGDDSTEQAAAAGIPSEGLAIVLSPDAGLASMSGMAASTANHLLAAPLVASLPVGTPSVADSLEAAQDAPDPSTAAADEVAATATAVHYEGLDSGEQRSASQSGASQSGASPLASLPDGPVGDALGEPFGEPLGNPLAGAFGVSEAGAVEQDWEVVGPDRRLTYTVDSAYAEEVSTAASDWEALGTIPIEEVSDPEAADLQIGDAAMGQGALATTYSDGRMLFNTDLMEPATPNAKLAAASHEWGHVQKMAHAAGQESVMNTPITTNASDNPSSPTAYDEEEYYRIWGEPEGGSPEGGSPEGGSSEGGSPESEATPVSGEGSSGDTAFPTDEEHEGNYEDTWGGASPGGGSNEIIEIGGEEGAAVYSISAGEVVEPAESSASGGEGASVLVRVTEDSGPLKEGDHIYYTNLADPPEVSVGDTVEAGDEVGEMAATEEPSAGIGWYVEGERAEAGSGAKDPYDLLQWLEDNAGSGDDSGGGVQNIACPEGEQGGSPGEGGGGGGGPSAPGGGPERGKDLVDAMMKYVGTPYEIGGLAPAQCNENVIDCDCHVYLGMRDIGEDAIADGHVNGVQGPAYYNTVQGEDVTNLYGQDLQAGDIIVWEQAGPILGSVPGGHIAVATGNGKEIVHAIPPEGMVSDDYTVMYPEEKVTVSRIVRMF